jgi:hypothetical protein
VKVVQVRLGHSSAKTTLDKLKTTLDNYGHLFEDEEDKTRAAIDAGFGTVTACRRPEPRGRGRKRHRRRRSTAHSTLDVVVEHGLAGDAVVCSPFAVCVVGLRVLSWRLELRHMNSGHN